MRGGVRAGAGRPKGARRVRITLRVLPKTKKMIDKICFLLGISRGELADSQFLISTV